MKANVLVLILLVSGTLGLVSCSPDKKKSEEFRLPEPEWSKAEGKVAWLPFTKVVGKSLDLSDRLEFDSVPKGTLRIQAACNFGDRTFDSDKTLPMTKEISVFEFFEPSLIAKFSAQSDVNCTFNFIGANGSGSTHKFELQRVRITDRNEQHSIRILQNDLDQDVAVVPAASDNMVVRLLLPSYDSLTMHCTDSKYEVGSMGSTLPFKTLIANGPIYETNAQAVNQRTIQRCRVFSYLGKRINGISQSFAYVADRGLPVIANIALKTYGRVLTSTKFNFQRFSISNPSSLPTRVKIPKLLPDTKIRIVTGKMSIGNPFGLSDFTVAASTAITNHSGALVSSNDEAHIIELRSNQSAVIEVTASPNVSCHRMLAASVWRDQNLGISLVEELEQEVLEVPIQEIAFKKARFGQITIEEVLRILPREGVAECN